MPVKKATQKAKVSSKTTKKASSKPAKASTSKNKGPGRPRTRPEKKPRPEEAKPLGAPTKYRKEYDDQAYKLCLLGMIDSELADFFEVEESTINNWKKDFPSFLESMRRGKKIANAEVAHSLFKRATGFKEQVEKPMTVSLGDSMGSEVQIVQYTETYPPDASAAFRFLHNREPEKWRDKQEIKFEGMPEIGVVLDLPKDGESNDADGS